MKACMHSDSWGVQMGEVEQALQILALVLDQVPRAQALCQKSGTKEAYMSLLAMLLHPPDGRPAKYVEACRVLASPGKPRGTSHSAPNYHSL